MSTTNKTNEQEDTDLTFEEVWETMEALKGYTSELRASLENAESIGLKQQAKAAAQKLANAEGALKKIDAAYAITAKGGAV